MFGVDVYAAYGMTETVIHAITGKPCGAAAEPGRWARWHPATRWPWWTRRPASSARTVGPASCGCAAPAASSIFLEYFDNPEANAKSFEDGWFKTGDMVRRWAGGNVFYLERDKDLIKVGGENVSAREVEEVVAAVPGVAQVAVVGKKHECSTRWRWPSSSSRLTPQTKPS